MAISHYWPHWPEGARQRETDPTEDADPVPRAIVPNPELVDGLGPF